MLKNNIIIFINKLILRNKVYGIFNLIRLPEQSGKARFISPFSLFMGVHTLFAERGQPVRHNSIRTKAFPGGFYRIGRTFPRTAGKCLACQALELTRCHFSNQFTLKIKKTNIEIELY